jgi:hypothetical protein
MTSTDIGVSEASTAALELHSQLTELLLMLILLKLPIQFWCCKCGTVLKCDIIVVLPIAETDGKLLRLQVS